MKQISILFLLLFSSFQSDSQIAGTDLRSYNLIAYNDLQMHKIKEGKKISIWLNGSKNVNYFGRFSILDSSHIVMLNSDSVIVAISDISKIRAFSKFRFGGAAVLSGSGIILGISGLGKINNSSSFGEFVNGAALAIFSVPVIFTGIIFMVTKKNYNLEKKWKLGVLRGE